MSEKDVRPKALASYMEKRNQRFAAMSQTARRIKIELNHTWRFRLLPVEMGPDKEPFVDIAQHWWAKQPITCPRHTAEAWGGSPDANCPVCEIADRLRESNSEEINGIGYKARCNLRVRAWCIVFDQEDAKGDVDDMPMTEILNPYEFDMYKTTWESFAKFQKWALSGRRGGKEASELGLLDIESGCDLLATQGAKGVTLDRCDPGPIFPLNDPKFEDYLAKIWSRIHKPQIVIPAEKDLYDVAAKIEECAERGGGGGGGGRRRGRDDDGGRGRGRFDQERGRGGYEDEANVGARGSSRRSRFAEDQDADANVAPARGSSRRAPESNGEREEAPAPPTRRRAPEPEAEQEQAAPPAPRRSEATQRRAPEPAEAEQQAPEEPVAPPVRRAAAPRRAPEPEPEVEQEQNQEEQAPAPLAPPPARRGSAPTAPPSARRAPAQDEAQDQQQETPQRPPARRAAAPPPAGTGVDEEEDNVPDERREMAPAVRGEKLADEAPPGVSAQAPAPKRSVGDTSDIKARLDKLNSRGR